jgi:hypothetical protein
MSAAMSQCDIQKKSSSKRNWSTSIPQIITVHLYWHLPSCCCDECRGMRCPRNEYAFRKRSWIYWSFGPGKKILKPLLKNIWTPWLKTPLKRIKNSWSSDVFPIYANLPSHQQAKIYWNWHQRGTRKSSTCHKTFAETSCERLKEY